jgi:hypothetical protein
MNLWAAFGRSLHITVTSALISSQIKRTWYYNSIRDLLASARHLAGGAATAGGHWRGWRGARAPRDDLSAAGAKIWWLARCVRWLAWGFGGWRGRGARWRERRVAGAGEGVAGATCGVAGKTLCWLARRRVWLARFFGAWQRDDVAGVTVCVAGRWWGRLARWRRGWRGACVAGSRFALKKGCGAVVEWAPAGEAGADEASPHEVRPLFR